MKAIITPQPSPFALAAEPVHRLNFRRPLRLLSTASENVLECSQGKKRATFMRLMDGGDFRNPQQAPQPLPDMKKRKRHKTASTKRNEFRLIIIKRLVDKWSNCSDEFKLAFKLLIDEILVDVKKRHIARYHDLIDYLSGKAESRIEQNENLFPEQKNYLKIIVRLKAELIKRWPYIRKPFWPGEKHGRIARR